MKPRTPRTDAASVPTCTSSTHAKSYTTAQFRAVQESLQTCSQNPFQRVDGAILERLHKQHTRPNPLDDIEDALL